MFITIKKHKWDKSICELSELCLKDFGLFKKQTFEIKGRAIILGGIEEIGGEERVITFWQGASAAHFAEGQTGFGFAECGGTSVGHGLARRGQKCRWKSPQENAPKSTRGSHRLPTSVREMTLRDLS